MSKFSQVKYSILSFYCTVLFTGSSAKKTLKSLLHTERLRITQETLQISLFASMFLSLVKNTALHFLFTVLSVPCAGRSTKEGFNHLLHREFIMKNQETMQISVFSLILLNLVKNASYFLFIARPCLQSGLNHLIHRACLRKKLGITSFIEHV